MNQEFIDAYPQGISLSQPQRLFVNKESLPLYHQVELKLNHLHQPDKIKQILEQVCDEHFCLTAIFKAAPGYRGVRQFPTKTESQLIFEHVDTGKSLEHAELLSAHPVNIRLDQGVNLHAILASQTDNSQLLILRIAALTADMNSLISMADLINKALVSGYQPEEVLQYPQYIEWQQDVLDSEEGIEGKAYWQQYLTEIEQQAYYCHLPYRLPEELHQQPSTLSANAAIPTGTLLSLQRSAQQLELQLSDILQGAWWLLVAKITGKSQFVGGWNYDPRAEFEELMGALGVYQQVLPIKVDYNTGSKAKVILADWLKQNAGIISQHSQWAESSSEEGEQHNILIGFSQSPLVNNDDMQLQGYQESLSSFELLMNVANSDESAIVTLNYLSSAYTANAVAVLINQYLHLLSSIEHNLSNDFVEISLLSSDEKKQLLALNTSNTLLEKPVNIIERIYHQASNNGQKTALTWQDQQVSYSDLVSKVDELANWLVAQGVGTGDKVALCLPRSSELVISLLAVMRARACYIPVDPSWPEARKNTIYQNSTPTLVLHDYEHEPLSQTIQAIDIKTAMAEAALLTPVTDFSDAEADDIAYIIYTSGSTGVPKGVVIEQQQLSQYCAAVTQAVDLSQSRNFALTSTVAADLGNTSLFGALYNGASLHIASDIDLKDGINFQVFLSEKAIDCLKIVPTHLQALLEGKPEYLPLTVILGGEACSTGLINKLYQLAPQCRIFNHYGPSETTIGVMIHSYKNSHDTSKLTAKLSQVLAGSQVVILNENQQLCAIGELGQLTIGGSQLAQRYIGLPVETGFCELTDFGGRWYPTGDLARYFPDYGIGLAGRCDEQIKIRGFRVEPAEVEQGIISALNVDSALIQSITQGNHTQLIAYFVSEKFPQGLLNEKNHAAVLEKLRLTLTEAMLPQHLIVLKSWPLLANGKVDKNALPNFNLLTNEEFIAPVSPLQSLLAGTMSELLSMDNVSTASNFFDLGADSLMVIRFVTRIRKLLLVDIEPGFIFDNANIMKLEKALVNHFQDSAKLQKLAETQLILAKLSPEQQVALRKKMA
jgi:amino acid adenylation domain-containing protein